MVQVAVDPQKMKRQLRPQLRDQLRSFVKLYRQLDLLIKSNITQPKTQQSAANSKTYSFSVQKVDSDE